MVNVFEDAKKLIIYYFSCSETKKKEVSVLSRTTMTHHKRKTLLLRLTALLRQVPPWASSRDTGKNVVTTELRVLHVLHRMGT